MSDTISNGSDTTWDGTDKNGSLVSNGVYFYTYEGIADDGTEFSGQGTVTVVSDE